MLFQNTGLPPPPPPRLTYNPDPVALFLDEYESWLKEVKFFIRPAKHRTKDWIAARCQPSFNPRNWSMYITDHEYRARVGVVEMVARVKPWDDIRREIRTAGDVIRRVQNASYEGTVKKLFMSARGLFLVGETGYTRWLVIGTDYVEPGLIVQRNTDLNSFCERRSLTIKGVAVMMGEQLYEDVWTMPRCSGTDGIEVVLPMRFLAGPQTGNRDLAYRQYISETNTAKLPM